MRKDLGESFEKANGIKLGYMSFFVKAACEVPSAIRSSARRLDGNATSSITASYCGHLGRRVDRQGPGHAEAARRAGHELRGHRKARIAAYAKQAREGGLKLEDLQGGTFTITNGGTFGSLFSTPIVNPAERDPRHAHDQGTRHCGKWCSRRRTDDVRRNQLRPPHHRRQGRGAGSSSISRTTGEPAADTGSERTAAEQDRQWWPESRSETPSGRLPSLENKHGRQLRRHRHRRRPRRTPQSAPRSSA